VSASRRYAEETANARAFTERGDRYITRIARAYDRAVPLMPFWRRWLSAALPHLRGPRVLEVSFGTGWLLTQYADRFEAHGVDLNQKMLQIATRNLQRRGLTAQLQLANVEALPYPDETFDTVLNTMAFTGYPDATTAMGQLSRVLKADGELVMIDLNYPHDDNRAGRAFVALGQRFGDLVRNMGPVFHAAGLHASDEEIGGFGSIHLYRASKRA
jgi:ubiquinone/menaquinone biosynthesis C-methylase UbiE